MADTTNQEAREALQACEQSLADAFEASNDIDEKTAIFKTMQAVHKEIVAAAQAELRNASGTYTLMTQDIRSAVEDLKKIQAKIDTIIVNTQRAAEAIKVIAKVVEIAAKAGI
jgi:VCBS repeat-containing protein